MSEDPKSFDLIAALAGRSYPEETVDVFLNEQLMYTLGKLEEWSATNPHKTEEYETTRKELLAEFADEVVKVHIKGVPRYVLRALGQKFEAEYPGKKDHLTGNVENTSEEDEIFEEWVWRTYITKFENAEGGVQPGTDEVIHAFREQAPQATLKKVQETIDKLRLLTEAGYISATDKDSGYEAVISSPDFS